MELLFLDAAAEDACRGKKEDVVALVHQNIGLVSAVDVSSESEGTLKLDTARGIIIVARDLSHALMQ